MAEAAGGGRDGERRDVAVVREVVWGEGDVAGGVVGEARGGWRVGGGFEFA